jgi:hypothetical protein
MLVGNFKGFSKREDYFMDSGQVFTENSWRILIRVFDVKNLYVALDAKKRLTTHPTRCGG